MNGITREMFDKLMAGAGLRATDADYVAFRGMRPYVQIGYVQELMRMSQPVECTCTCDCEKCSGE